MEFEHGISVLRLLQPGVEFFVAYAEGLGRHRAGLMTRGRGDNRDVSGHRSVWEKVEGSQRKSDRRYR